MAATFNRARRHVQPQEHTKPGILQIGTFVRRARAPSLKNRCSTLCTARHEGTVRACGARSPLVRRSIARRSTRMLWPCCIASLPAAYVYAPHGRPAPSSQRHQRIALPRNSLCYSASSPSPSLAEHHLQVGVSNPVGARVREASLRNE